MSGHVELQSGEYFFEYTFGELVVSRLRRDPEAEHLSLRNESEETKQGARMVESGVGDFCDVAGRLQLYPVVAELNAAAGPRLQLAGLAGLGKLLRDFGQPVARNGEVPHHRQHDAGPLRGRLEAELLGVATFHLLPVASEGEEKLLVLDVDRRHVSTGEQAAS